MAAVSDWAPSTVEASSCPAAPGGWAQPSDKAIELSGGDRGVLGEAKASLESGVHGTWNLLGISVVLWWYRSTEIGTRLIDEKHLSVYLTVTLQSTDS